MLLKYFYDPALAHASYLVGCQKTQEAIVIDPGRDIAGYLAAATREGLRITAAAETHIHADFVSGARELAAHGDVTLLLSDAGPADWKYTYASAHRARLLQHNDTFDIGRIAFRVLHTPGHTPEHIAFLVTDRGAGQDQPQDQPQKNHPIGIFTGDFVFVGAVGRPDLLETAAGIAGSAETGARALYHSVQAFKQLPDYLQVWPAHGAGSACGKGLGAIPSSTVGYEKLANPALQLADEDAFVRYILAGQPETPRYFSVMKRMNKSGPAILGAAPPLPPKLDPARLPACVGTHTVIDIAPPRHFARAHVPGTWNVPVGMLGLWAGSLVDVEKPVHLIAGPAQLAEAVRVLRKIGVDAIPGWFDREEVERAGLATQSYAAIAPAAFQAARAQNGPLLMDVRARTEWNEAHIPGAQHVFLGSLPEQAPTWAGRDVVVQCLSIGRSAVAASILQAAGARVSQLTGGLTAWQAAGLPVESGT